MLKISVIFILSSYKLPRERRSLDVYDTGDSETTKINERDRMVKKKNVPVHIDCKYSFYSEKKTISGSLQLVDNYFIKWQTNYKNLGIVVFILERANKNVRWRNATVSPYCVGDMAWVNEGTKDKAVTLWRLPTNLTVEPRWDIARSIIRCRDRRLLRESWFVCATMHNVDQRSDHSWSADVTA